MNNRGNLSVLIVVVVTSRLLTWGTSSLLIGFMVWCIGSNLTLGTSLIIGTLIWLLLVVGALIFLKIDDV